MKPLEQHAAHCVAHYGHSMCTCGIEQNSPDQDIKIAEYNMRHQPSDFWPGFFLGAMCAIFWALVIWGLS